MTVSTDAIIFFGYHLPEGTEIPDEASDLYGEEDPVQVGWHCSDECLMPYVFWTKSEITARRGFPKEIPALNHTATVEMGKEIRKFAKQYRIPEPGEIIDPNWPDEKASELNWWLVSYWG